MASLCTWLTRVPVEFEFGGHTAAATLTVKRASVERREQLQQLARDLDAHTKAFSAVVMDPDKASKMTAKQASKLKADSAALAKRMAADVEALVVGVEGVTFETGPGVEAAPADGKELMEALDGDQAFTRAVWHHVTAQQFLSVTVREPSSSGPDSTPGEAASSPEHPGTTPPTA